MNGNLITSRHPRDLYAFGKEQGMILRRLQADGCLVIYELFVCGTIYR
ncbi:MAG: hypothetical protein OIN87_10935 [Candidatus Methanoperedens sp.]|nr:hypothetical protein [Candidatus Methanoperedens sp.]